VITGDQLRSERETMGIVAAHVALLLGKHPAYVTRLEHQAEVSERVATRYRRALIAIREQKRELGRQIIKRVLEVVP